MKARIGQKAPPLSVAAWVQGEPVTLDELSGQVILVEVFQVNCPGCFLYSLPQAVNLYRKYSNHGLVVVGIATAFEDFDKNNLENLTRLAEKGEVTGETLRALSQHGKLTIAGRLPYPIPFPLAMDRLSKRQGGITDNEVAAFIRERIPDFEQKPPLYQQQIRLQVQHYFEALSYHAETFETFELKGTPSHILIDKQGRLRACAFGAYPELEENIKELLEE
ncbi:Alkyl hydroperoxide reductase/thiol specific antioxidant/Mal allergen [Candidatus Methylobacter favarea]|uniref:Alkyl hydroperoxide reductase/thiol specific antioxidant/Mal allergen n=1 Tax=Candidatus Methylobacter favarea TaxID=2707345 RepID=A0A8S0X6C7_9GAMM|nr:redoxin family protein [Candidatus Methylobacter favarea]CAA9888632.1 Alkyl hydroperoxide reductase/thiol specific antioxidant/Mal allergen [Candidatus Methylobacter favarea]